MPAAVLGAAGENARPVQPHIVGLADAEDLAGVLRLKIVQRIIARHAGDSRNQKRQRRPGG